MQSLPTSSLYALPFFYIKNQKENKQLISESVSKITGNGTESIQSITVTKIIDSVTKVTGVSFTNMIEKDRKTTIREARQIAQYLIRKHTTMSFTEIGHLFKKDHSSIIHSCKVVPDLIETDERIVNKIVEIEELILCK